MKISSVPPQQWLRRCQLNLKRTIVVVLLEILRMRSLHTTAFTSGTGNFHSASIHENKLIRLKDSLAEFTRFLRKCSISDINHSWKAVLLSVINETCSYLFLAKAILQRLFRLNDTARQRLFDTKAIWLSSDCLTETPLGGFSSLKCAFFLLKNICDFLTRIHLFCKLYNIYIHPPTPPNSW